jgi:hypothetical protein
MTVHLVVVDTVTDGDGKSKSVAALDPRKNSALAGVTFALEREHALLFLLPFARARFHAVI